MSWSQWQALPDPEKARLDQLLAGGRGYLPYTWWDWHFMTRELQSGHDRREISPGQGYGPHESVAGSIPDLVGGPTTTWSGIRTSKAWSGESDPVPGGHRDDGRAAARHEATDRRRRRPEERGVESGSP